jgi:hypothetical protein
MECIKSATAAAASTKSHFQCYQNRQCTCNLTLWRVCVTTVVTKTQQCVPFIVELHVTVKSIKCYVGMQTQQWVTFSIIVGLLYISYCFIIIIIISIQPLGRFWQEPEPSQATFRRSHFRRQILHVPINARAPSSEKWNCGREWSGNFAEMTHYLRHLGIFYMSQICDMGQTALLPFRRKTCWEFFRQKNPTA